MDKQTGCTHFDSMNITSGTLIRNNNKDVLFYLVYDLIIRYLIWFLFSDNHHIFE